MKHILSIAGIAGALAVPLFSVSAATFLPVNTPSSSIRDAVEGDVYGANQSIVIAAPVDGDVFSAGSSVDISGDVRQSIFATGRVVTISGDVGDDVRTAGSIVSINSRVAHDLMAAGSMVTLTPDSSVGGDAYLAAENLTISGTIAGDIRFTGSNITITGDANIAGDVIVYGTKDPVIENGATIGGDVTVRQHPAEEREHPRNRFAMFGRSTIALLALALVLFFVAFTAVKRTHAVAVSRPILSLGIGAVWMLLGIPASFILLFSGLGTFIGLVLAFGSAALFIASFGISIILIGEMAQRIVSKEQQTPTWHHAVYGAVIMFVLHLLGGIGFLVAAIVTTLTFGALLIALRNAVFAHPSS